MRIIKKRGAAAVESSCLLPRFVGFKILVVSAALAAPLGAAVAAPAAAANQPALRPVDDRGLLDAVADRGSALITGVRDGATGIVSNVRDGATGIVTNVRDSASGIVSGVRDGATGLIDSAMNFLGVRYKRGGNSAETGFDCSGFTRYVFENSIGRVLPHRADEQANDPGLDKVDRKDLQRGDLVFFNTMNRTFSHVGIYLGDGKFIHSPRSGETIRVEDINLSYWARHFTGARRVPELAQAGAANGGDAAVQQNGLLASLTARLSAQGNRPGAAVPGMPAAGLASTPTLSASLNPSGLKIGSTLPSLPDRSIAGFAPLHQPLARPVEDR